MITANITKAILSKVRLTQSTQAVYSTVGFQKPVQRYNREKRKQRDLKPYEKLFYSSPLMNINIEMILAINQLRPKATYIIAAKNGQFPKQISNSTYNIVECLNYIQGFKYFYKSFPSLVQNMTKILSQKIDFQTTGLYKSNSIKKLVLMLSNIDSIYGQLLTELVSVFLIWTMQSSIKIKRKLVDDITPLRQRLTEVNQKIKAILQQQGNDQTKLSQKDKQAYSTLKGQKSFIQDEIKKLVFQNRFLNEQDFLCGLHYCLQHGYYNETIVQQFIENILKRDNYALPEFEFYLKQEQDFFSQKPLSNIFNKKAVIYARMYSGAVYRIKILNELKKMKKQDAKFMDFLKVPKNQQDAKESESSSSEQSPFLNGQNGKNQETSQSSSEQKVDYMSDRLVEQSLIPKKAYINIVSKYIQLLERKDVLCYILSQEFTSEGFRVLETEFFSYLNEQGSTLTIADVKTRYLNIFKEIFNIEKNGTLYVESANIEAVFEVILRMYDYGDRKQIFEVLKQYERYLLSKNMSDFKTVAPFYVFEKYNYKSNFVASKLFEFINLKYRLGREDFTIKEELVLVGNEICRYLSLYFKLLEPQFSNLLTQVQKQSVVGGALSSKIFVSPQQKINSQNQLNETKQTVLKYQQQFQQAIEIFLNNYNKMISVIYLEKQNSGFIGKGIELSGEYLKTKFFSTKSYEQALFIEGKLPEQDIKKIIMDNSVNIQKHRKNVKNVYQKQFETTFLTKSSAGTQVKSTTLTFNPYAQSLWVKKSPVYNPIHQVSTILDIVETAIQLQTMKNMEFYEDVLVVFKSIFQNKKLVKLLSQQLAFPEILKKLIKITHLFKGSYKNESNKLFESVLNLTSFNLNNFLHNARISIARQIINADKSVGVDENFQPYIQHAQLNTKLQKNIRIWEQSTYQINKQNVVSHIRSDIIHCALTENTQLQKIIREQLANIKTIRPSERTKNIKFQLNYLQYPYLANVAINKNHELIVVLVRKSGQESEKPYNAALNNYYEECENYFRKKGNKVIVATNQTEVRNSLRDLIK